jgi:hypothetical protein
VPPWLPSASPTFVAFSCDKTPPPRDKTHLPSVAPARKNRCTVVPKRPAVTTKLATFVPKNALRKNDRQQFDGGTQLGAQQPVAHIADLPNLAHWPPGLRTNCWNRRYLRKRRVNCGQTTTHSDTSVSSCSSVFGCTVAAK